MKKLSVIAMALVSTIAFAQHDQKQTLSTGSKSSQDVKTKTSHSSNYSADVGTIEGSYKITLTAKTGSPAKSQTGMNSTDRMNNSSGTSQVSGTNNQSQTSKQNTNGISPSQNQSSQYNTTSSGSNMGTSTPQSAPPQYNEGTNVSEEGTENQSMKNNPDLQNKQGQNSQNSISGNQSNTAMQNNASAMNYSSLAGKTMVLTLKNGKLDFCDKEKSKSENNTGSKSNSSSSENNISNNSASMGASDNIAHIKNCQYTKTSGQGSTCTIIASCDDNSSNKSYWNAYIDESKINGSVSFVTTGSGSTEYSFTGTRIAGSGSKKKSNETSER